MLLTLASIVSTLPSSTFTASLKNTLTNNISSITATIARNTIGLILICLKIIHIDHPMWHYLYCSLLHSKIQIPLKHILEINVIPQNDIAVSIN